MFTKEQIEKAKKEISPFEPYYEHDDCILIAYLWLDAQKKLKRPSFRGYPIKHMIENWAGRFVSQCDVEVAAHMHPEIFGEYPCYNISARLTDPSIKRSENIGQAFTQNYREYHEPRAYHTKERGDFKVLIAIRNLK